MDNKQPDLFEITMEDTTREPALHVLKEGACDDLADVPVIRGPLTPKRGCLLLPPWDLTRLSAAYRETNWGWSMTMQERIDFWKRKGGRPEGTPEERIDSYVSEVDNTIPPSVERLRQVIDDHVAMVQSGQGTDIMSGGLIVFRSLSGRVGLACDGALGDVYARLK